MEWRDDQGPCRPDYGIGWRLQGFLRQNSESILLAQLSERTLLLIVTKRYTGKKQSTRLLAANQIVNMFVPIHSSNETTPDGSCSQSNQVYRNPFSFSKIHLSSGKRGKLNACVVGITTLGSLKSLMMVLISIIHLGMQFCFGLLCW